jgi:hypothetical protein
LDAWAVEVVTAYLVRMVDPSIRGEVGADRFVIGLGRGFSGPSLPRVRPRLVSATVPEP